MLHLLDKNIKSNSIEKKKKIKQNKENNRKHQKTNAL